MDLGILKLVNTVTTGLMTLTEKLTSMTVTTVTAAETAARTLNHGAEMAEMVVVATKSELEVEFTETLAIMKAEAEARVNAANQKTTSPKPAKSAAK